jgi:hypothetical protein
MKAKVVLLNSNPVKKKGPLNRIWKYNTDCLQCPNDEHLEPPSITQICKQKPYLIISSPPEGNYKQIDKMHSKLCKTSADD